MSSKDFCHFLHRQTADAVMRFSIGMALVFVVTLGVAHAKTPPGPRFADVVHEHFEAWDFNHNGKLEAKEIDTLMRKQSIQGDAAAALAVLKLRERRTPPSIRAKFRVTSENVDDLDSMEDDNSAIDPSHAAKPFRTEPQFRRYRKTLETMTPRLFAGDGPDFSVMKQGNIGDCFFFCMTGYLASHHPNRIRPHDRGGTRRELRRQVPGWRDLYRACSHDDRSARQQFVEQRDRRSLAVRSRRSLGKRLRKKSKDSQHPHGRACRRDRVGRNSATVITLYSGHKAKSFKLRGKQANFRLNELRHELTVALSHGRMVGLSMDPAPNEKAKIPGLGYHHAYAIMDFDEKEDVVTIWNPWGTDFHPKGPEGHENGYAREHGIFHLPLKTMYYLFACVDVETTERVASKATSKSPNRNSKPRR